MISRLGTLLLAIVLVETLGDAIVHATRRNQQQNKVGTGGGVPIVGETPKQRRKGKKTTDCHFGRLTYEIEDIWHPDLGPPFGIMYCVECECIPIQKKRRIVGRVRCKNIKNECPEPACEDPVLLTGKCCKTCPQDFSNGMQHEGELGRKYDTDDGDKSGHEYASLLTSDPTVPLTHFPTLGSGRFALHRRNLHYSVHYAGPEPPSMTAFTDEKGQIIEEHEAHVVSQFNSTYKICGVWPKVPKVYRKLLKQDGMYVRLTSESFPDGVVGGRVTRFYAVKTETFSTLLTPSGSSNGGTSKQGGMAIISTASANSASHFLLIFHDLLGGKDGKDTMVSVRLESIQRDDADGNVIEETLVVAKTIKDSMAAEFKMDFDPRVFRQMARGKLLLSVAPKHSPETRLSGIISPKVSCSVYHAVLSEADVGADISTLNVDAGAGQALFHLTEDGSIMFKVQIEGISAPVKYVGLETQAKKRWRPVHDLTSSYRNNWANGTISRLSARDIELLMGEEFYLTVGTDRRPSHLRGQIKQRLFGESQAAGNFPLLLRPYFTSSSGDSSTVGQAWLSVDTTCRVHYEIIVGGGLENKRPGGNRKDIVEDVGAVELLDVNTIDGVVPTMADVLSSSFGERRLRHEFVGLETENVAEDLDKQTMSRLDTGNAVLQVSVNSTLIESGNTSRTQLRARVINLRVPPSCLPSNEQNEVAGASHGDNILMDEENNQVDGTESYKCIYDGRLVDEGAQWTASKNACSMCNCQRGRVVCDTVVCPPLSCSDGKVLHGDCCPMCSVEGAQQEQLDNNQNLGCYFEGDNKFHVAGSKWHPYVPPFGFSRCAICTCNATTLKVNCPRILCQPLTCPEKEAYREHPMACCKVCPNPKPKTPKNTDELQDEGATKDPTELLAEGGCKFRGQIMTNGMEWHPRVQPFGEIRCIRCYCKDGKTKCKRHKCPALSCQNKVVIESECCPKCADGSASSRMTSSIGSAQLTTYKHKNKPTGA